MKAQRQRVVGQILLIQEERFRLRDDEGRGYLFTLAHELRGREKRLGQWQREGTPVVVEFSGKPNKEDGIAHSVYTA